MYPLALADSFRARPWGIYPHAFFGLIALAIGPFQFRQQLRVRNPQLHRRLGQIYMTSALLSGLAGLYMSLYSYGGMVTHSGFALLGIGLLTSCIMAWVRIRQRQVQLHREWVIRSFAFLFSAVTLRLWLPVLVATSGSFDTAYLSVAWLCWVPNIIIAELWIQLTRKRGLAST